MMMLLSGCGCEVVDTGHRGVKANFGKVEEMSLPEGLYFYNPFTSSIIEMNVQEQVFTEKAMTYTKDVQLAEFTYAINYYPERDLMHKFYQDFGLDWDKKIVPQVIQGALKAVVGQYDAVVFVSERAKAVGQMEALIKENLKQRNVVVTKFEVTNVDFSKEFEKSVEAKVIAIQKAEEAKNKTVEVQEEAKQKIIAAEAEAKSMKIRSEALSQNKSLVEYEAVQKWDGKLPQYMMSGGSVPFINLK